jgi:transposase
MLTIPPSVKLWYAPQPVDFRLGFDGLFALVRSRLAADPLSGHLLMWPSRSPFPCG